MDGLVYSPVTRDRRGNVLKLHQWKFRLDIRRSLCTERVVKHCNGLPREKMGSPCLEVFKKSLDVAISAMVNCQSGDQLRAGVDYLGGLF